MSTGFSLLLPTFESRVHPFMNPTAPHPEQTSYLCNSLPLPFLALWTASQTALKSTFSPGRPPRRLCFPIDQKRADINVLAKLSPTHPIPKPARHQGRSILNNRFQAAVRRAQADAIQSTTRSPIMTTVAWLPPDLVIRGFTEASTTDNHCTPFTLQYWSTTAIGSESGPILHVPDTCLAVPTVWRI